MALFVVAYDLKTKKDEDRDYGPIEDAIKDLDFCHVQKSLWLVSYDGKASELRDFLRVALEDRDFLLVVEFSKPPAGTKAMEGTSDWINAHFLQSSSKSSKSSSGGASGSVQP